MLQRAAGGRGGAGERRRRETSGARAPPHRRAAGGAEHPHTARKNGNRTWHARYHASCGPLGPSRRRPNSMPLPARTAQHANARLAVRQVHGRVDVDKLGGDGPQLVEGLPARGARVEEGRVGGQRQAGRLVGGAVGQRGGGVVGQRGLGQRVVQDVGGAEGLGLVVAQHHGGRLQRGGDLQAGGAEGEGLAAGRGRRGGRPLGRGVPGGRLRRRQHHALHPVHGVLPKRDVAEGGAQRELPRLHPNHGAGQGAKLGGVHELRAVLAGAAVARQQGARVRRSHVHDELVHQRPLPPAVAAGVAARGGGGGRGAACTAPGGRRQRGGGGGGSLGEGGGAQGAARQGGAPVALDGGGGTRHALRLLRLLRLRDARLHLGAAAEGLHRAVDAPARVAHKGRQLPQVDAQLGLAVAARRVRHAHHRGAQRQPALLQRQRARGAGAVQQHRRQRQVGGALEGTLRGVGGAGAAGQGAGAPQLAGHVLRHLGVHHWEEELGVGDDHVDVEPRGGARGGGGLRARGRGRRARRLVVGGLALLGRGRAEHVGDAPDLRGGAAGGALGWRRAASAWCCRGADARNKPPQRHACIRQRRGRRRPPHQGEVLEVGPLEQRRGQRHLHGGGAVRQHRHRHLQPHVGVRPRHPGGGPARQALLGRRVVRRGEHPQRGRLLPAHLWQLHKVDDGQEVAGAAAAGGGAAGGGRAVGAGAGAVGGGALAVRVLRQAARHGEADSRGGRLLLLPLLLLRLLPPPLRAAAPAARGRPPAGGGLPLPRGGRRPREQLRGRLVFAPRRKGKGRPRGGPPAAAAVAPRGRRRARAGGRAVQRAARGTALQQGVGAQRQGAAPPVQRGPQRHGLRPLLRRLELHVRGHPGGDLVQAVAQPQVLQVQGGGADAEVGVARRQRAQVEQQVGHLGVEEGAQGVAVERARGLVAGRGRGPLAGVGGQHGDDAGDGEGEAEGGGRARLGAELEGGVEAHLARRAGRLGRRARGAKQVAEVAAHKVHDGGVVGRRQLRHQRGGGDVELRGGAARGAAGARELHHGQVERVQQRGARHDVEDLRGPAEAAEAGGQEGALAGVLLGRGRRARLQRESVEAAARGGGGGGARERERAGRVERSRVGV